MVPFLPTPTPRWSCFLRGGIIGAAVCVFLPPFNSIQEAQKAAISRIDWTYQLNWRGTTRRSFNFQAGHCSGQATLIITKSGERHTIFNTAGC